MINLILSEPINWAKKSRRYKHVKKVLRSPESFWKYQMVYIFPNNVYKFFNWHWMFLNKKYIVLKIWKLRSSACTLGFTLLHFYEDNHNKKEGTTYTNSFTFSSSSLSRVFGKLLLWARKASKSIDLPPFSFLRAFSQASRLVLLLE